MIFSDDDALNLYANDSPDPVEAGFVPLDPTIVLQPELDMALDALREKHVQYGEHLRRICDAAGVPYFGTGIVPVKDKGCAGQFVFYADALNPGDISHEVFHAVCWMQFLRTGSKTLKFGKTKTANDAEEDAAHLLGDMTKRIWAGCRKVFMATLAA